LYDAFDIIKKNPPSGAYAETSSEGTSSAGRIAGSSGLKGGSSSESEDAENAQAVRRKKSKPRPKQPRRKDQDRHGSADSSSDDLPSTGLTQDVEVLGFGGVEDTGSRALAPQPQIERTRRRSRSRPSNSRGEQIRTEQRSGRKSRDSNQNTTPSETKPVEKVKGKGKADESAENQKQSSSKRGHKSVGSQSSQASDTARPPVRRQKSSRTLSAVGPTTESSKKGSKRPGKNAVGEK
jgi:hypothetical protein